MRTHARDLCVVLPGCVARRSEARAVVRPTVNGEAYVLKQHVLNSMRVSAYECAVFSSNRDVDELQVVRPPDRIPRPPWFRGDGDRLAVPPPSRGVVPGLDVDVAPRYVVDVPAGPLLNRQPRIGVEDRDVVEEDVAHLRVRIAAELDRVGLAADGAVVHVEAPQRPECLGRLGTDAVVCDVDNAVTDGHVHAGVWVNAVVVWKSRVPADGDPIN
mmetsp:Transcript_30793/g.75083  ORF Transcript_30793/g.75083 Transcript_30793/m.75083 type:complete len:215 (-) Transcript_30793:503-1147(-)